METDSYVWCTDPEEAWILAKVVDKTDEEILLCRVVGEDNDDDIMKGDATASRATTVFSRSKHNGGNDFPATMAATTTTKYTGVELANSVITTGPKDTQCGKRSWKRSDENLITLPHLHEPAILQAISERFFNGQIYTWTGPVLIAVNPFRHLPIYNEEILQQYRTQCAVSHQESNSRAILPHVYAVADRAFLQMMTNRKSQSILISGESGAGKTESTKIVMKYLTTVGSSRNLSASVTRTIHHTIDGQQKQQQPPSNHIMDRVLQSNPILEAFGNAVTLKNSNSSRFGKFIELGFDARGHLLGAKVQTYLLERVRLASHAMGERNYHIFYQLIRGGTIEQLKSLALHDQYGAAETDDLASIYNCTNQGGVPYLQQDYNDGDQFQEVQKAMKGLGWSTEKIHMVLSIVAGLLHLGQIQYRSVERGGIEVAVVDNMTCLQNSAHHLGVDLDKLEIALTQRTNVIRGEEITSSLSIESAVDARDALAKTLYGALFLWLVGEINSSIAWKNDKEVYSSCGVLDIFGFECFETNSFEQLCINFANESLQQQFNKFVFELEQTKYEEEGIDWTFISFPNNQDCLDVIQRKKTGILAILDDELKLPGACDKNFAGRMFKQLLPEKNQIESNNGCFSATRFQKSRSIFCVRHFAGNVQYSAETGFVEKNRDEIPVTAKSLFQTAPSQLIRTIFKAVENKDKAIGASSSSSPTSKLGVANKSPNTIGMQFKKQLDTLIFNVQQTDPHYIRCLKPNDEAKPDILTRKRLAEQLRSGGVLEAVRVARMGYPIQMDHAEFLDRFWAFTPFDARGLRHGDTESDSKDRLLSEKVLDNLRGNPGCELRHLSKRGLTFDKTDIQIGLTKVFIRQKLHGELETLRTTSQNTSASQIQGLVRGFQQREWQKRLVKFALTIQKCYRGWFERKSLQLYRSAAAGALLVKNIRMFLHRRRFLRAKSGINILQTMFRNHYRHQILAVAKLQANFRMYLIRKRYLTQKACILSIQRVLREYIASRQIKKLEGENYKIKRLKEDNKKIYEDLESMKRALQQEKDRADELQDMVSNQQINQSLHLPEKQTSSSRSHFDNEESRNPKHFNHGTIVNYMAFLQQEEEKEGGALCTPPEPNLLNDPKKVQLEPKNHYKETQCESSHNTDCRKLGDKKQHHEAGDNITVKVQNLDQKDAFWNTDRERVITRRFIFLILFLLGVNLSCMVPLFRRRSVMRELLYALNLHSEDVSEIWDIVSVALANLAA